ncbi:MAG: hypothetical protein MZV63_69300 [Marinilabiliales bacterium]|nr:hypothetical protein [Marinilabiliales bacterium]
MFLPSSFQPTDPQPVSHDNEDIRLQQHPWALPENVTFAGEPMPLQNFDTRESLDRELNATAYRHGSTLLTIKRAGTIFPGDRKDTRGERHT